MSSTAPETQSPPTSQFTPRVAPVGKPRGRGKKCYWYDNETKILIDVLQEIACDPAWKTDGCFRSNYLTEVYKWILSKMPNFSKQISPHIESKVKWRKTKFHAINDMLKQSGCQWDSVEKKTACERDWYESYILNHKEANGLWDFKFPYLDQLELVYGRDRATGATVEGYGDAIHNMEVEQNVESGGENVGDSFVSLTDDENDMQNASQATPTTSNINNARKNGK
ncbi:myb/SANT-like domain-containing protein [Artemisia annua]|uniref:Myb/SANT-like domain-containing protein n=1 Tax=Artemisia annua TaxID=35608 RepID=A0A2U1NSC0_ARTAN|nr:myb/SANT-like domain-containing protein [Artemisia annua]